MKTNDFSRKYDLDEDAVEFGPMDSATRTPEQRLLFAVLERAVRDYLGGAKEEVEQATQWLYAEEHEAAEPFSFPWVCESLALDRKLALGKLEIALEQSKRGALPFFLDKRFADSRKNGIAQAA